MSDDQNIEHVSGLLNELTPTQRDDLLSRIEELEPSLAEALRDALFTFADLIYVEDKGLQRMLRDVDRRLLALALRGEEGEVREKILANLSRRAGEDLLEEVSAMGRVRLSDVHTAQRDLARQARTLHEEGQLVVVRPGDDDPLVP